MKFCEPTYQEISKNDIPTINRDGMTVKLIAGEAFESLGPIKARTPAYYMDIQ